MKRREFITLLGSAAAGLPLTARAQQAERVRRIGVLNSFAEADPEAQAWDKAFRRRLDELGWIDGRNVRIDYRWGTGNVDRLQLLANELVQLDPDVLVTVSTSATAAMQQQSRTIPIVFGVVADPIGSGFVGSLHRPGGNITGFINQESSSSGKWLGLMREIAPKVSQVAFLFNPKTAPYARFYLETFRSAATALAIEPIETNVHSAAEIEAAIAMLGSRDFAGLIVMPEISMQFNRATIIKLANEYRLPTIYPFRFFATDGGLLSYGFNLSDSLRGVASYVDRIFRGAKPDELPCQLPTKFELTVNLKTAKQLGINISSSLLARADEVIE